MSRRLFTNTPSAVKVYKMHAALVHLLESMEKKLPRDLYQDMYATLLAIGTDQIIKLHAKLQAGDTATILHSLVRKTYRNRRDFEANSRILRHAQKSRGGVARTVSLVHRSVE